MVVWQQVELPLIDPLEPRILPQDGGAWFTLSRVTEDGRWTQTPYRLRLIEPVMTAIGRAMNVYITQGLFELPNRRAVHLSWLTHAYVDIDTYRSAEWQGLGPDDIVRELLWFCADEDIPPPSIIMWSGRGLYCKWFWSSPITRAQAGMAIAVNRALCRRMLRFHADPNAVDVSRVLRVVGTVNSKSGGQVAIVWTSGAADGGPVTYDFIPFARAILPVSAAESPPDGLQHAGLRQQRRQMTWREGIAHKFNWEDWHWGVLEDVRALAGLRFPGGIVQPGSRDLYGHLAACQLARVIQAGPLFHEIVATARSFLPSGYIDTKLRGHCSTLLRRATDAAEGEIVPFLRDGLRTPIWTYSKARMMDMLRIGPDEERGMTRLISDAERERRRTERRRDAGEIERGAFEAAAAARRDRARTLRDGGLAWAEVARRMDLPTADAARMLASRDRA